MYIEIAMFIQNLKDTVYKAGLKCSMITRGSIYIEYKKTQLSRSPEGEVLDIFVNKSLTFYPSD